MKTTGGPQGTTLAKVQSSTEQKVAGSGSAAIKYDILTALLAMSAQADGPKARLALRLSLVITARFNWRLGRFNVGQRELAKMWGVTERTAKREMAQMRVLGWISVETAAARGRVAQHRINFPDLLKDTMPYWESVGPDFVARLVGGAGDADEPATNVVPLRGTSESIPAQSGKYWPSVADRLRDQNGEIFQAWFAKIEEIDVENDELILGAPNRFVAEYITTHFNIRVLAAVRSVDPALRGVRIVSVF